MKFTILEYIFTNHFGEIYVRNQKRAKEFIKFKLQKEKE